MEEFFANFGESRKKEFEKVLFPFWTWFRRGKNGTVRGSDKKDKPGEDEALQMCTFDRPHVAWKV